MLNGGACGGFRAGDQLIWRIWWSPGLIQVISHLHLCFIIKSVSWSTYCRWDRWQAADCFHHLTRRDFSIPTCFWLIEWILNQRTTVGDYAHPSWEPLLFKQERSKRFFIIVPLMLIQRNTKMLLLKIWVISSSRSCWPCLPSLIWAVLSCSYNTECWHLQMWIVVLCLSLLFAGTCVTHLHDHWLSSKWHHCSENDPCGPVTFSQVNLGDISSPGWRLGVTSAVLRLFLMIATS